MVGGRVIEVCEVPGKSDRLWVDVVDRPYGRIEHCHVLIERCPSSLMMAIGDSIWWQSGVAYWTPQEYRDRTGGFGEGNRQGVDFDIPVRKIGGSGVSYKSACMPTEE